MSPSDGDLGVLLAVAAGWTALAARSFPQLKTSAAPRGITSLQLAFATKRAAAVVAGWRAQDRLKAARRSQLTDVAFIVSYVTVLASGATLVAHATDAEHAQRAVVVALVAGGLDLIEDAGLALQLRDGDRQTQPVPMLTSIAATGKFASLVLFGALLAAEVLG